MLALGARFQFLIYLFYSFLRFRLQFPSLPFILVDFVRNAMQCLSFSVLRVVVVMAMELDSSRPLCASSRNLMDSRDRRRVAFAVDKKESFFCFLRKRSETNEL